jgi:transcriptional regulator with XRE-family HTH domain
VIGHPLPPPWRATARLGLSYQALADQCGISKSLAVALEQGRRHPSPSTIGLIADALALCIAQRTFLLVIAGYRPPWSVLNYLLDQVPSGLPASLPADWRASR